MFERRARSRASDGTRGMPASPEDDCVSFVGDVIGVVSAYGVVGVDGKADEGDAVTCLVEGGSKADAEGVRAATNGALTGLRGGLFRAF